jgi:hypothetical protein
MKTMKRGSPDSADEDEDEALRARVIQAYERLGIRLEETLDHLRGPDPASETRLRVATPSSANDEASDDEESQAPRTRLPVP